MPRMNTSRRRRAALMLRPTITAKVQRLYNIWRDAERKEDRKERRGLKRRDHVARGGRLAFERKMDACYQCPGQQTCDHFAIYQFEDGYRDTKGYESSTCDEDSDEVLDEWTSDEDEDEGEYEGEVGEGGPSECELEVRGESPPTPLETPCLPPFPSPPTTHTTRMDASTPTSATKATPQLDKSQDTLEFTATSRIIKMEDSDSPFNSPAPTSTNTPQNANSTTLGAPFEPTEIDHINLTPTPSSFFEPANIAIGIGRQLPPFGGPWECVYAAGDPPTFCGRKYWQESELKRHFSEEHHPIKEQGLMGFFVCRICQMYNIDLGHCLQCGFVDPHAMEYWLCGYPIEENAENVSSGSMTEGRTMDVDENGGYERMLTEAINEVGQEQYGLGYPQELFSLPPGFHRSAEPRMEDTVLTPGPESLFSTPRSSGPEQPRAAQTGWLMREQDANYS